MTKQRTLSNLTPQEQKILEMVKVTPYGKGNRPKISLCIIARDEGATIRESILSIRSICDEIVIGIDNRSSDETEAIAKELADVVYYFDWNGSFSDARNEAIKRCNNDWVFIWDAHEFIDPEPLAIIKDKLWAVVGDDTTAIGFKLIMEDGAVGMQLRLLNKKFKWKYSGAVHNQLNPSFADKTQTSVGFRDIYIFHRPTKANRDIRRVERHKHIKKDMGARFKEDPKDVRSAYYLASISHEKEKFEKAIKYYLAYLKNTLDIEHGVERYLVTWQIGRALEGMSLRERKKKGKVNIAKADKHREEAKEYFRKCIAMRYEIPLAYTTLAEIFTSEATILQKKYKKKKTPRQIDDLLDRKWSQAEFYYKVAIELAKDHPMPDTTIFYPGAFFTWLPVWNLGKIYEMNAMFDQALACVFDAGNFPEFPYDMKDIAANAVATLRSIIKDQLTLTNDDLKKLKIRVNKKKKNLVIFDSIGSFTVDIANELKDKYNVVVLEKFNPRYAWWADIVWYDFCDNNVIDGASMLDWESQLICRVHGYEAYESDAADHVRWGAVDDLIFVSDHLKTHFMNKFPDAQSVNTHVIHNGFDLSKFTYKERGHGTVLGSAGFMKAGKNPALLLHILSELPGGYQLKIAGQWQNQKEQYHFISLAKSLGYDVYAIVEGEHTVHYFHNQKITDRNKHRAKIKIEPWVEDMDKWLDSIDYLVSPSISESFSFVIAEAMAKGIKPVVAQRDGASDLWGDKLVFKTVKEAALMIKPESPYNSRLYREIAEKYSLANQMKQIRGILKGKKVKVKNAITQNIKN